MPTTSDRVYSHLVDAWTGPTGTAPVLDGIYRWLRQQAAITDDPRFAELAAAAATATRHAKIHAHAQWPNRKTNSPPRPLTL